MRYCLKQWSLAEQLFFSPFTEAALPSGPDKTIVYGFKSLHSHRFGCSLRIQRSEHFFIFMRSVLNTCTKYPQRRNASADFSSLPSGPGDRRQARCPPVRIARRRLQRTGAGAVSPSRRRAADVRKAGPSGLRTAGAFLSLRNAFRGTAPGGYRNSERFRRTVRSSDRTRSRRRR